MCSYTINIDVLNSLVKIYKYFELEGILDSNLGRYIELYFIMKDACNLYKNYRVILSYFA